MIQSIMNFWSADKAVILGLALSVSEGLALIPGLKSNSILQLVINSVQSLINGAGK